MAGSGDKGGHWWRGGGGGVVLDKIRAALADVICGAISEGFSSWNHEYYIFCPLSCHG